MDGNIPDKSVFGEGRHYRERSPSPDEPLPERTDEELTLKKNFRKDEETEPTNFLKVAVGLAVAGVVLYQGVRFMIRSKRS